MNPKSELEKASSTNRSRDFTSAIAWSSKLESHHTERVAIVYVRQSTAHQVLNHRESAARQYALVDLAVQLGWPSERIVVIDEDQGQSGASAEGRSGFQGMLTEVSLNHVGIILGIELSRLARSNKDWHQLIELCAIFGTMLADQDGLYCPTDYNDRLLLGLRGIMNEAELHILRGRMHQALLNKAKRGEIYIRAPIGYVKLPTGKLSLDPDEQVQSLVRMVFDEFDRRGSVRSVLRFFQESNIQLPIRLNTGPDKGDIDWRSASPAVIKRVLSHELYAGMYRFGQRQTDPRRKKPGRPDSGRVVVTPDKYHALIPNHCPAYISEDRYRRNQERIRENRFGQTSKGGARNGKSMLAGILYCTKCGRRMAILYSGKTLRYYCTTGVVDFRTSRCQSLSGKELDRLVVEKVLKAIEPASLEISILASSDIETAQRRIDDNWKQRLERARFEVDRARRQHQSVEPENRLVARELERQWETSLEQAQSLEQEYARFRQTTCTTLSAEQQSTIRSLAESIPSLWDAQTTTNTDRQRVVRLLIDRVEVDVQGTTEHVDVALHWSGGFTSHHELTRPVRRYDQTADFERLKTRIDELMAAGRSYAEIATRLNEDGFRPAKQTKLFNKAIVGRFAKKFCQANTATDANSPIHLEKNEWTMVGLSKELSIPRSTLDSWKQKGWLSVLRQLPGYHGQIIYWASDRELQRLHKLRNTKWHYGDPPLPQELTTPLKASSDG